MSEELNRLMGISETVEITPEMQIKASREVHRNLKVSVGSSRTYVIVVAVHEDSSKNFINKISCKKGVPIGGYAYDAQSDSYYVECADFLHLGYVPLSFNAIVEGCGSWLTQVPMPESVIKKYLSTLQKNELKNFRNHFKKDIFKIQFIQMIDPN